MKSRGRSEHAENCSHNDQILLSRRGKKDHVISVQKNALRDVSGSHRAEYLLADGQPESFKGSIANTNSNGERGLGVMLLSVPLLMVQF